MSEIYEYTSLNECITNGTHLTDCDEDGYCNFCGHQESAFENERDKCHRYKIGSKCNNLLNDSPHCDCEEKYCPLIK